MFPLGGSYRHLGKGYVWGGRCMDGVGWLVDGRYELGGGWQGNETELEESGCTQDDKLDRRWEKSFGMRRFFSILCIFWT